PIRYIYGVCGVVVFVVLWCCGIVVLWYCGVVVLWCCGVVVLWCSRFHRPAFSRKSGIRYDVVLWFPVSRLPSPSLHPNKKFLKNAIAIKFLFKASFRSFLRSGRNVFCQPA